MNERKYNFSRKEKNIICIIFLSLSALFFFSHENTFYKNLENKIKFDKYEVSRFYEIKDILDNHNCSQMWKNQREFLNGIIRKFKPKKVLEIGVASGSSSIIILNAIKDVKNSRLYSIDLFSGQNVGYCAKIFFPKLIKKWSLFTGNIASEFMEKIGNNIDLVFIDTAHFEPGEIMDFLIVLPFLKENAIAIFHDIGNQITKSRKRQEWAPYIIFNAIRGKKILPSGNEILTQDIGAIILEGNQKSFYHDYFRLLGGQWQYFPKELHINSLRKYFSKYYDKDCITMFEEAVSFNREFVKNNPKYQIYKYNSD